MNVDTPREFVDTNILVYAFDASAGVKHATAANLIRRMWEERTGCLSVQVLQEFYVTLTRKLHPGIDGEVALELVHDFSPWPTHSPTSADVEDAIRLHLTAQISFWDAMVIQSAVRCNCAVLWSEDLTHGRKIAGVLIQNPFAMH